MKIISVILLVIIVLLFVIMFTTSKEDLELKQYWSCMDGCYEMQIVYETQFNITINKERQFTCNDKCWDIYDPFIPVNVT